MLSEGLIAVQQAREAMALLGAVVDEFRVLTRIAEEKQKLDEHLEAQRERNAHSARVVHAAVQLAVRISPEGKVVGSQEQAESCLRELKWVLGEQNLLGGMPRQSGQGIPVPTAPEWPEPLIPESYRARRNIENVLLDWLMGVEKFVRDNPGVAMAPATQTLLAYTRGIQARRQQEMAELDAAEAGDARAVADTFPPRAR